MISRDLLPVVMVLIFVNMAISAWFFARYIDSTPWARLSAFVTGFMYLGVHRLFVLFFDTMTESSFQGTSHKNLDNVIAIPFAVAIMYLLSQWFRRIKGD